MEYLFAEKEEILFSSSLLEKNNKVVISGVIEKNFEFSHSLLSENFYFTRVGVEKNSGVEDLVPIMVSNLFFDGKDGIESDLENGQGYGRIQSRVYNKRKAENSNEFKEKIAYEASIERIETIDRE